MAVMAGSRCRVLAAVVVPAALVITGSGCSSPAPSRVRPPVPSWCAPALNGGWSRSEPASVQRDLLAMGEAEAGQAGEDFSSSGIGPAILWARGVRAVQAMERTEKAAGCRLGSRPYGLRSQMNRG
jgi:hypothetical protein